MKRYPKYKDSGVEWIGEIPENWDVKRLKFLSNIKTGESDTVDREDNGKYPFFVRAQTVERKNTYSYDGEAVLTAGDGVGVGRVYHYINGKFDYHQRVYKISDFKEIVGKHFFYYMKENFHKEVMKISAKSTVDSLRLPMFLNFPVAFGSIKEQKTIANYLDHKTHQIDTLIDKKQNQIELLKEQRTAIINHAVTKGLDPNVKMKDSGIEWLGEIPAHWEIIRLKYISSIKYGLGQPPRQIENGLPLIRATNIERGKINEKNLIFVDPDDIPYERDPVLKTNDIIVVRSGAYTADSAIIPEKFNGAITGYDLVVRAQRIDPKLLAFVLLSKYVLYDQLYLHRLRAAQPHLNVEELGESLILSPPSLQEQLTIVDFLESTTTTIDDIIQQANREIEFLKEYRTTLISDAVTGKIDVRNEVPA